MSAQDLLIKDGYVVTMDPGAEDLPRGDVLIGDGIVQQIGADLPVADARERLSRRACPSAHQRSRRSTA